VYRSWLRVLNEHLGLEEVSKVIQFADHVFARQLTLF